MKRKLFALLLCFILITAMTITVSADIGPKPSVRITFTGIQGETYYGTLLSLRDSTGPASAWDGTSDYPEWYPEDEKGIWEAFIQYEDVDGYYFLQEWWDCSESNQLNWTYYPPVSFKILLYFPETESFYVSPVYERYAFDSYFTVDLSDYATGPMMAEKSYDYTWELISLAARIVLTILLELSLAWIFGFRDRKTLGFLAVVNMITQVTLNVALNIVNYNSGSMNFVFSYVLYEILVFAVEAVAYTVLMKRITGIQTRKGKAIGYAFVANAASFALGLWLAHVIPGIF